MAQMAETFLLSRFSLLSCGALAILALYTGFTGQSLTALAAVTGMALVWTSAPSTGGPARYPRRVIQRSLFALWLAILLANAWIHPHSALSHWLYGAPLVALALLPLGWGAAATLLCVSLVMATTYWSAGIAERHQLASAFLLTAALSAVMVFLREYKSRQLAPLRRTDELTQAASRNYLSADLHKEIQRSEREGTDLSVVMIGLDAHLSDSSPDADIRAILPGIGRFLHGQLRDFDTYYRMADLQFLIILPGVATPDAAARAESICKGLRSLLVGNDLDLTVSAGVAGLNIGDDADSLHQSAASALRRAQQQGGGRVQSYSSWSHQPPTPNPADAPQGLS